jgi:hypothetical protein
MSERKNIDRLFQEKFKEFEVAPSDDAWGNIEAKLEKKKRRVIPLWWKLSGVAAVFLIGFLISKSIYDDGIKTENPVVNKGNPKQINETKAESVNKDGLKNNSSIQTDPGDSELVKQNAVVNQAGSNNKNQKNTNDLNNTSQSNNSKSAVAATPNERRNTTAPEDKNTTGKTIYSSKSSIAERKPSHHRSLKNKPKTGNEKALATESILEKSQNQVAQNTKNNTQPIAEKDPVKQIAQTGPKEKNNNEAQASIDKKNINLDVLKGTNNSKIATKEIEKKVNDTAPKTSVANNELEELLNEKESKLKIESKKNRWQLTSNVAPIFLGSVSNGSPIDSTLSKNSKSYNTNVGFGVGVSYTVNKKLSVRTGLNKVNMSYDTNDISFFTGIQAKTLANVNPTASSRMIHVESTIANNNLTSSETELLPFETSIVHESTGYLRQEMGYLEMPVEMTYNLLDKKFGVKIIGGFSTLFLQENSITIVSQDRSTLLGEANNLNDVHFSTNLGLGLKYSFFKSFEFNVEPTVKYQLNTYNANAGNFKPYYFGIYSGISYKF